MIHSLFLGIVVHKLAHESLFFNQEKYVCELLIKVNMMNAKLSSIPMVSHPTLSTYDDNNIKNGSLHRSVVSL